YGGAVTGSGALNVEGGLTLTMTGDSAYGGHTTVTGSQLRLASGGSIATSGTTIGGTGGVVTVSGPGSSLTTATLQVGVGGTSSGALNVENGGVVRVTGATPAQIGAGAGSPTGTLNVTGAGSLLEVADALAVGTSA